jgi:hypothetical protein
MSAWAKERARQAILEAAKRMLGGDLSYVEGAREICANRFTAGLEDDPDILPFATIDSETDRFPLGVVRSLWNQDALKKLQPEMDGIEGWARSGAADHCRALVRRLGNEA